MTKKSLFFVLLFWLFYLLVPSGRQNLRVLFGSPGTPMNDGSNGGLIPPTCYDGPQIYWHGWPLPYANDALGTRYSIDALWQGGAAAVSHSQDAPALAWWLDENFAYSLRPSLFTGLPLMDWDRYADEQAEFSLVTKRGGAIDPGNAFFPWMAAQEDMNCYREWAATRDLRRALACSRYDDYIGRFYGDGLKDLRATGPLRVADIFSCTWGRRQWPAGIAFEVSDFARQFAKEPSGPRLRPNFQLAMLLLQMGKFQRTRGINANARAMGACLEFGLLYPPGLNTRWGPSALGVPFRGTGPSRGSLSSGERRDNLWPAGRGSVRPH